MTAPDVPMLTDRDLGPEVGYTDEEIRGLCVLAAAAQTANGSHAAFGMTVAPEMLARKAAGLVDVVTAFVRHGTVPEVPGAE